jgi:targeting protein for Xklp2
VSRSRERPLSSEEKELKEVEKAKTAEEERMKKNKQYLISNKARSSVPVHAIVRSTKELTIPNTPIAHLSKRLGEKKYSTTSSPHADEVQVRPYTAPPGGMTQPEPFNFRTDARASASRIGSASTEAIPTAAEAALQFQKDPRSHNVPNAPLHLTEPSSPKLRTKVRAQSTGRPRPKSFQEKEEEAMAEASKHVFKFKPVDKRIFSSMGELGVPKVPAKECTSFDEFTFRYEERASTRHQQRDQHDESTAAFKALPMPDFSKAAPLVHVQHVLPVTRPISPKLSCGQRASSAPARRQRPHHDEVKRMKEQQEAEEREQRRRHLSLTEPQAFNFRTEERGKAFQAALELRIRQEQEEERRQRDFKAQPVMKAVEKPFVPEPCKQELTDFQEFHLATDSRHEASEARLRAQLEREKQQLEEESKFHARPVPKSIEAGKGFVPHLEEKEPTKPLKIALQSDERAEKRRLFEEELARRQKLLEAEKARIQEMEAKKENEKVQELRRKLVSEGGFCFKAAPVFKARPSSSGASVRASVAKTLGMPVMQQTHGEIQTSTDAIGFEAGL